MEERKHKHYDKFLAYMKHRGYHITVADMDRCLKKAFEGLDFCESLWLKLKQSPTACQKLKYEAELSKEVKKLKRRRDSMKAWIHADYVKDKDIILDLKKEIENQMQLIKAYEREAKRKAYSKEALGIPRNLDPFEKECEDLNDWLVKSIDTIQVQLDLFESEIESMTALNKRNQDSDHYARLDQLKYLTDRHSFHMDKLETLLRTLDNLSDDGVATVIVHEKGDIHEFVVKVCEIKEDLDYYLQENQKPDFQENMDMYEDLVYLDKLIYTPRIVTSPIKDDKASEDSTKVVPDEQEKEATNSTGQNLKSYTSDVANAQELVNVLCSTTAENASNAMVVNGASGIVQNAANVHVLREYKQEMLGTENSGIYKEPDSGNVYVPRNESGSMAACTQMPRSEQRFEDTNDIPDTLRNELYSNGGSEFGSNELVDDSGVPHARNFISDAACSMSPASDGKWDSPISSSEQHDYEHYRVAAYHPDGCSRRSFAETVKVSQKLLFEAECEDIPNATDSYQTHEGFVPPFLGANPFGKVPLQDHELMNSDRLDSAWYHRPLVGDSERSRPLMQRMPCETPSYYPQTPLKVPNLIDFYQKCTKEILFFIFYFREGTLAQYYAARQLKQYHWRYHTKFFTWFQRHEGPIISTLDFEQGSYLFFDVDKWCQRRKDGFIFEYKYLENSPIVATHLCERYKNT